MEKRDVVLCAPVRTAIGTFGGSLATTPASRLGARVIAETMRRSGVTPESVEGVVMGQVIQAGCGMNPARQAALGGGISETVPAMTVNRVCGSGAQSVVSAAQEILAGSATCMIGGGMENMDLAPYLLDKARSGYRLGDATLADALLRDGLTDAFSGQHSGWVTEDLADSLQISRDAQDAWAERSQQRFADAQAQGRFVEEITAVEIVSQREKRSFDRDEHNRPDTTRETLSRLKPAFRPTGTITAGNAPGLNSAAAAMIVAERAWAERSGVEPMARIVSFGIAGVAPGMFGLGPVPAIKQALTRANWRLADVERAEINEAFAAVAIGIVRTLGLAEDIVNVEGGAIAHGHPIGATGAVLLTRLLHSMRRDDLRRGLVALCIGGGQGIAIAVESLH